MSVSVHDPSQSARPPSHTQSLDTHDRSGAQLVSQSPQCASSLVVSKQCSPHAVSVPSHTQNLSTHELSGPQPIPPSTQFASSLVTSTQLPEQSVSGLSQRHELPMQLRSIAHGISHPLQCASS